MAVKKRYFRALVPFMKTPLHKLKPSFPEKLSGWKRKTFDLNTFVLEAWKATTQRRKASRESFLAMDAFSDYISRMDDLLDRVIKPSTVTERVQYKKDVEARKIISLFVSKVKALEVTPEEKKQIFKLAGTFRQEAWNALAAFEKNPNPSMNDVIRLKEATTGSMGKVLVAILNAAERIPEKDRPGLEAAFVKSFMATQIADDIFDIKVDKENKIANLALIALQVHPKE